METLAVVPADGDDYTYPKAAMRAGANEIAALRQQVGELHAELAQVRKSKAAADALVKLYKSNWEAERRVSEDAIAVREQECEWRLAAEAKLASVPRIEIEMVIGFVRMMMPIQWGKIRIWLDGLQ